MTQHQDNQALRAITALAATYTVGNPTKETTIGLVPQHKLEAVHTSFRIGQKVDVVGIGKCGNLILGIMITLYLQRQPIAQTPLMTKS